MSTLFVKQTSTIIYSHKTSQVIFAHYNPAYHLKRSFQVNYGNLNFVPFVERRLIIDQRDNDFDTVSSAFLELIFLPNQTISVLLGFPSI